MKAATTVCDGISNRANMFTNFLTDLDSIFLPLIYKMSQIIVSKGTDYRNFSSDKKKVIAQATTLAGAIKSILDTPILDKDGNLTSESARIIDTTNAKLICELV
jgi:transmembrane protein